MKWCVIAATILLFVGFSVNAETVMVCDQYGHCELVIVEIMR